jgi:signal peptide peptidase SppA
MRDDVMRYEHVIAFAMEHPWALTPWMRAIVADVLSRRLTGDDADPALLAAATELRATRELQRRTGDGHVAVIPIAGVIAPRMNLFTQASGGTSFDGLTAQLRDAVDNPKTKAIVFDVDSPGGNVAGASEFAREVMRARTKLPVIAQANHLMASAAYWPMAGATEIVASPSAHVGAIGVYGIFDDISEALAKRGIKREVFSAGKYKAEGADGTLTDEARTHLRSLVQASYVRFIGDVAKGRGLTTDAIRDGYGQGRSLPAEAALEAGLIDRIDTMDDTLARVTGTATAEPTRPAGLRPAATLQEPSQAATNQEQLARIHAERTAFERRVLELG